MQQSTWSFSYFYLFIYFCNAPPVLQSLPHSQLDARAMAANLKFSIPPKDGRGPSHCQSDKWTTTAPQIDWVTSLQSVQFLLTLAFKHGLTHSHASFQKHADWWGRWAKILDVANWSLQTQNETVRFANQSCHYFLCLLGGGQQWLAWGVHSQSNNSNYCVCNLQI